MSRFAGVGRGLFGLAVLCALGAGSTQAVASSPGATAATRSCNTGQCSLDCEAQGYYLGGCINFYRCECYNP